MKTFFFSLIIVAGFSINLKAQKSPEVPKAPTTVIEHVQPVQPVIPIEPVQPILPADPINEPADQDTSVIRIGEKEVQVIDHQGEDKDNWFNDKHRRNRSGKFDGHWEGLEMGFNGFDNPDYIMYDGVEFMSLDQGKSMEVNINFYQLNIGLIKSYVGLVSGIGLSFNSYRFENPYTLRRDNEMTEAILLDTENLEKTKLAVSFLQVPLLFEFKIPVNQREGKVYVNVGVVGGVKIGSHTKVKYGDEKEKDRSGFNMNSFKYAATARIGYKDIGLFGTYSLTPLFESGKGPELTPFTIGISFMN